MANYYELLKIAPSASDAEINSAVDSQYNQWRRLVTHHDPNVVNQANQALQIIQQIRDTLTNPDKRSVYDVGIGVKGTVAGLADPTAFLESMRAGPVMAPPSLKKEVERQPVQARTDDLWTCSKCGTPNPQLSISCFKCGAQLMRDCPECNEKRSLIKTGVCGNCGYKYEIALKRQQIRSQIAAEKDKVGAVDNEYSRVIGTPLPSTGCAYWIGFLLGGGGLIALFSSSQDASIAVVGLIIGIIGIVILVATANNSKKQKHDKEQKLQGLGNRREDFKTRITTFENELLRLQK